MGAAEKVDPEIITAKEAAALLRIDIKTVYASAHNRQLPGARWFRGTLRIHRPTLIASMVHAATK